MASLAISVAGCAKQGPSAYPARPIKLVVPFEPGGGTDNYARIIKKAFDDNHLLPQPLVIINRGGAGATIGSRYVKNAPPDGYTVLLLHDAILTAQASGKVNYGPADFVPVAGTGEVGMVIAVRDDATWDDLRELMDDARDKPDTIRFGANLGAPTHYAGLMLEREAPGARFRFAQIGGGAQRLNDLIGGHIEVTGFSFEEYARYRPQGVRGLAYLAEKRHPAAPDLPTAREQGFDIANANTFYWWFPKGTPPDRVRTFAAALHKALDTDFVRQKMAEIRFEPLFITGDALNRRIAASAREYEDVSPRRVTALPDIPAIVGAAALLMLGVVVFRAWRSGRGLLVREETENVSSVRRRPGLAWLTVALTIVYVGVLSTGGVDYRVATFVFLALLVTALSGWKLRSVPLAIGVSLVTAEGIHALLTRVFVVDLP